MIKIFLYGELWEGTHIDSISKVLNKLKIENHQFNFYEFFQYNLPFKFLNKVLRKVFVFYNRRKMNLQLLRELDSFNPSVFLISKGIDIYPDTLKKIKRRNIKIVNWNPDDFFNLKNSNKNLIASLKFYDIVFSARKHLFHEYKIKGIKNPIYLEWYYIPGLHLKNIQNDFSLDKLTFIGSYSKRREEIINAIKGIKIEIWGSGWNKANFINKKLITNHNKILSQSDFPHVIGKSLINLNILTIENRDQTNLKIFEIVASGGILLTNNNEMTKKIMGDNCFYYDGVEDLNMVIQNIRNLSKDELLMKKQKSYLGLISNKNSIDDRVKEMLNHL